MQDTLVKKDKCEKKTRQGLSLPPEMLLRAKKRAGDNLSAYIRGLIEGDLDRNSKQRIEVLSSDILVDLVRRLLGERRANELSRYLTGVDQPAELERILDQYLVSKRSEPCVVPESRIPSPPLHSDIPLTSEEEHLAAKAIEQTSRKPADKSRAK